MSAWADNPQAAQIDALIERANRLMQDEKNALIDSFWWLDRISLGALYDELWGVATTAIEMAGRGVQLVKSKQRVADHAAHHAIPALKNATAAARTLQISESPVFIAVRTFLNRRQSARHTA